MILFRTGTHAAGFDFFNYNWNFWWIRHASTTPGLNIYENDFVMFPAMSNYGYHALTAFWYPVWAILQPFFSDPIVGTLTAINIIIFIACTLNGYLTFLFLRSEGVATGIALIGGAALQAFPISRYFYYNTHLNLMDWFWLPGLMLLWKRIAARALAGRIVAALIWGAIFGIGLWGLLLTDLQFPIFAAFLIAPYGLRSAWNVWRKGGIPRLITLAAAGALAVGIGVTLMWFAGPLPYIVRFEGELTPGDALDRPGIPLSGFVNMASEWWSWGDPSVGVFVTVAVIAAVGLNIFGFVSKGRSTGSPVQRKRDVRWFWFVLMLPPLILALGPTLRIFDAEIPLPYRWMHGLTNGMFRMPWRLAPVAVIAGMAFVGLTFTTWMRASGFRLPVRAFGGAAALLALGAAVRLFETAPLQPIPYAYSFYETMGRETGDYVVMEVPTAAGTGEVLFGDPAAIQYQWYGIIHGKRMINGFISRAPIDQFWYIVTDDPMMSWLGQRRFLLTDAVEAQLRQRIFDYPIGYIVIHLDLIGVQSPTAQEIVGYFNQFDDLLCHAFIEGDAVVYRTAAHPIGCGDSARTPPEIDGAYRIDIGAVDDWRYIGWGWHYAEPIGGIDWRWTGAQTTLEGRIDSDPARIYVDLPPDNYTLTLTAQSFAEARQLRVLVNGQPLADSTEIRPDGLQTVDFALPADLIGDGRHIEVQLATDSAVSPAEIGQGGDTRPLGIAVDTLTFTRQP